MKSKIRFFIIGSLIFLGILTGWIIPSNAAALNTAINVAEWLISECTTFDR